LSELEGVIDDALGEIWKQIDLAGRGGVLPGMLANIGSFRSEVWKEAYESAFAEFRMQ
jgi:hypothetical protein